MVTEIDLNRADILEAIEKYKKLDLSDRLESNRKIKKYFLVHEGENYPYAYLAELVERLDKYSRKKLRNHLIELGFKINQV